MKITLRFFLVLLCTLPFLSSAQLKVMSFNIRYDNPADGPNAWPKRQADLVAFIEKVKPDVLGLQEVLQHQLSYINSALKDYSYVGVGRDDGDTAGEFSPIFYQSSRFELLFFRTFWLSQTPDTVSVGWDAALPRIVSIAKLKDLKSNRILMVLNTHFDHRGKQAQEWSALSILQYQNQYQDVYPEVDGTVILGDFNAEPEQLPITLLAGQYQDAFQWCQSGPFGPKGTFNAFNTEQPAERRIDYIFSRGLDILEYRCINHLIDPGRAISDHWPILAYFQYQLQ